MRQKLCQFSRTDKKIYRPTSYIPTSILPNASRICERFLIKQLEEYFQGLLRKYQCGFRKGFSVINAFTPNDWKRRKSPDEGGAIRALLTDLSKAFDGLPYELRIVKRDAYGIDIPSL